MSKNNEQEYPEWFKGERYIEGSVVKNPFSGVEYELNRIELSMYDFIIGATIFLETGEYAKDESSVVIDLHKGLDWFRENNPNAYMALLD